MVPAGETSSRRVAAPPWEGARWDLGACPAQLGPAQPSGPGSELRGMRLPPRFRPAPIRTHRPAFLRTGGPGG